jgi:hypothetical protein
MIKCDWCGQDIMEKGYPYEFWYFTSFEKDGYGKLTQIVDIEDELRLGHSSIAGDMQTWGWQSKTVEGIYDAIDNAFDNVFVGKYSDLTGEYDRRKSDQKLVFCVEGCAIQRFNKLCKGRLTEEFKNIYHIGSENDKST